MVKTVKQIDVDDWDDLVSETYDKPYAFQQQDDCKPRGVEEVSLEWLHDYENDSIPFEVNGEKMGVSFKSWLETSPDETRKHFEHDYENDLFWDRNFYPHSSMILKDLCEKGLLEPGDYQIKIDW